MWVDLKNIKNKKKLSTLLLYSVRKKGRIIIITIRSRNTKEQQESTQQWYMIHKREELGVCWLPKFDSMLIFELPKSVMGSRRRFAGLGTLVAFGKETKLVNLLHKISHARPPAEAKS